MGFTLFCPVALQLRAISITRIILIFHKFLLYAAESAVYKDLKTEKKKKDGKKKKEKNKSTEI